MKSYMLFFKFMYLIFKSVKNIFMWTILKVLIKFVTILPVFFVLDFWL